MSNLGKDPAKFSRMLGRRLYRDRFRCATPIGFLRCAAVVGSWAMPWVEEPVDAEERERQDAAEWAHNVYYRELSKSK